jgi:hypothetical protein
MLKKAKKILFSLAFSPVLITPLFVTTSCSVNTLNNVEIVYDKKINVTDFFSTHNSETNSLDTSLVPS